MPTAAKRQASAKGKGSKPPGKSGSSSAARPQPEKAKASTRKPKRPVVWERVQSRCYVGDKAITAEQAKELLGYMEAPEGAREGTFVVAGARAFLTNNTGNRPLRTANVELLKQEILHRRWKLNGETFVIGETGLVLNGQHTLVALIEAAAEWAKYPDRYREHWKSPPTLEKIIIFGVKEDDDTVNTIDNAQPRTLADVIYRSHYFAGLRSSDRDACSRICSKAIDLLWYRTGVSMELGSVIQTHSESLDFLARHGRILECVRHIYEEDSTRNIGRIVTPGTAAGLMYLMGASATQREKGGAGYSEVQHPTESLCDWSAWDRAAEYWVLVGSRHDSVASLHAEIHRLRDEDEEGLLNANVRIALAILAWQAWTTQGKVTASDLRLEFGEDPDTESRYLISDPTCGGIDCGRCR